MNNQQIGKVWLVGGGPSDPGLMTLKGKEVLANAEVVVYDALIGQQILQMIPESAEAIDVGKRASRHTLPQDQISALLVEKAKEGKRVVRLKGGDPFLFGRGGEELALLTEQNIPFEVVPGVTSALAVPAYAGIPVTHRDYASSVHLITGHRRENLKLAINFEALVKAGGTLVFLMGCENLSEICEGLLKAGMAPDMPAALLMQGTAASQRRIVATLSTLPDEAKRQGTDTPAIIVVGEVCALSEKFCWYERQPLGGVRVILTRPRELIGDTAEALRYLGAEVLEMPTIKTCPTGDEKLLGPAFASIEDWQWIVFTSRTGVRIFFDEMKRRGIDRRKLIAARFAVIGEGTAKALKEYGYFADLMPEVYDGAHLGRALAKRCREEQQKSGEKTKVLIPRSAIGSPELIGELAGAAEVQDLPIYDTVFETERFADPAAALKDGKTGYVLFTSASTVRGFIEALPKGFVLPDTLRAVCIGAQTAKACEALGIPTVTAPKSSVDSLIETLEEDVRNNTGGESRWI